MSRPDDVTSVAASARGSLVERILAELEAGREPDAETLASRHAEGPEEIQHLIAVVRLIRGSGARHVAATETSALGDFQIVREIGRGGMGVVYEARQLSLDRRVALKVLLPGVTIDRVAIERFVREAQAAGGLHHKHIVPIYATGEHNGLPYYAMQYIDGAPLSERIRSGALAAGEDRYRQIAAWGVEIADALAHAHDAGIVHRDIKPGNLLCDADNHVWITDFGLAWQTNEASLTMTGDVLGTVRYMSPEQARGGGRVDSRADVYSLGVSLYELCSARTPFDGRDYESALKQVLLDEPPLLRRFARDVPGPLEQIIHRTLQKDPAERYPDAHALREDLQRYLEDRPLLYRPPGLAGELTRFARRNQLVSALVLTALLATVVFAGGMSLLYSRTGQLAENARAERDAARSARAAAATARAAAETREQEARQVQQLLQDMLASVDPAVARTRDTGLMQAVLADAAGRVVELDNQPAVAAALHGTIGRAYAKLGAFVPAQRHLDDADRLLADAPDPQIALAIRRARAELHHAAGEFEAAAAQLTGIIDTALALEETRLASAAQVLLAELLLDQERIDEAELVLEQVQAAADVDPAVALRTRWLLAAVPHYRGDFEAAVAAYEPLADEVVDTLGAAHPLHGDLLANLVAAHRDLGAFERADDVLDTLLDVQTRLYGPDGLKTLDARQLKASVHLRQHDAAAAVATLEQVVPRYRQAVGDRHPGALSAMHDLGLALREAGRHAEGEPLLREALAGCRDVLGPTHRLTRSALTNLVTLLHAQQRLAETLPLYRELYELETDQREALDDDALTVLHNFVFVLIRLAEHERAVGSPEQCEAYLTEAEPLAREGVELRSRAYGADDQRTQLVRDHLGILLELQGRTDEAGVLFRQILAVYRRQLGDEHMMTLIAATRLADCLGRLGQFEEAVALQEEAIDGIRSRLHPRDIRWAMLNSNYGWLLTELGRYDEAEPPLRNAYDQIVERSGLTHPNIRVTRERLLRLYDLTGQDEAAERIRADQQAAEAGDGLE